MAPSYVYFNETMTLQYGSNTNMNATYLPQTWTASVTVVLPRCPPRLRPPPVPLGRLLSTPTPRAASYARVEVVRRGRAEARPSRALRERRRQRRLLA
jgi:hypothetical protein